MPNPLLVLGIAKAALGAGGAFANYFGQQDLYDQNKKSAMGAFTRKRQDLTLRGVETERAGAVQERIAGMQADGAAGATMVGAAAAGVAGNSVDAIFGEQALQHAEAVMSLREQTTVSMDQIRRMQEATGQEAVDRINSVAKPSVEGLALDLGGTALGLGQSIYNADPTLDWNPLNWLKLGKKKGAEPAKVEHNPLSNFG